MVEPRLPSGSASVSDLMDAATRVFHATLAKCLPFALFGILFVALPNMYWLTTGKPIDPLQAQRDPKLWVLAVAGISPYQLFAAAPMVCHRAPPVGHAPPLRVAFSLDPARWSVLVLSSVSAWVPGLAGL